MTAPTVAAGVLDFVQRADCSERGCLQHALHSGLGWQATGHQAAAEEQLTSPCRPEMGQFGAPDGMEWDGMGRDETRRGWRYVGIKGQRAGVRVHWETKDMGIHRWCRYVWVHCRCRVVWVQEHRGEGRLAEELLRDVKFGCEMCWWCMDS